MRFARDGLLPQTRCVIIHLHGTPCGGPSETPARFLAGRHALVPFSYPDDLGVALEVCQSVVLDNGAFSEWKQGRAVDFDGYLAWVDSVRRHPAFDWAIIPDVIGGSEADNDALVASWPFGAVGVPCFHPHENLARLRHLATSWPRVAIGANVEHPTPGTAGWWRRIGECMDAICDEQGRSPCKLHGLRMLNPQIFTRLPLASADSTNAVRNANLTGRFGMYRPPNLHQRMCVIADRIEAFQSAPCWRGMPEEPDLFGREECQN